MSRGPPRSTLFPSAPLSRSVPAGVVGDLARHPPHLGRLAIGPDLDPPAHGPRVQAFERPPGRVPPQVQLSWSRSEEHTSELQSRQYLVCRLLLEKKRNTCST